MEQAFQTIARNALQQESDDGEIYLPEGIQLGAGKKEDGCSC